MQKDPDWKCDLSEKYLVDLAKACLVKLKDWNECHFDFNGIEYTCREYVSSLNYGRDPVPYIYIYAGEKGTFKFKRSDSINVKKYFISLISGEGTKPEKKLKEKEIDLSKSSEEPLKDSFLDMIKQDAVDGAYRTSANQINKVVKATIISQLGKNTTSEGLKTISNLLDTEMGGALISMLVGLGITYAPKISEDPRALKLAKEFRVNGMSTGMNQIIEIIVPAFTDVMNGLPSVDVSLKAPTKRVLSKEEDEGDENHEYEEEQEDEQEEEEIKIEK